MKPTVYILVSIPDAKFFESCTMCFDTLHVGFPTATIYVDINQHVCAPYVAKRAFAKATHDNRFVRMLSAPMHHAAWIEDVLRRHRCYSDGPAVILDADTCFWKSCEDWTFPTPLAGYYVPQMWNDFAQCVSVPRLHTSLLWINNTKQLFEDATRAYPFSSGLNGDYCPCDLFMPAVRFTNGRALFWDSCANLYNMIGGTPFGPEHLECYEHLNSAAFYKVMHERLENKFGFELLHSVGPLRPELLRGVHWKNVNAYYEQKRIEALVQCPLSAKT